MLIIECQINASLHLIFLGFRVTNSCGSPPKGAVNAGELGIFLFGLNGNLMLEVFLVSLHKQYEKMPLLSSWHFVCDCCSSAFTQRVAFSLLLLFFSVACARPCFI